MELTDAQIEAAEERGRIAQQAEPRASSARYDAEAKRIVVELTSGATYAFPPEKVEGLTDATDEQLAEVEVLGLGGALHWESLDVDYSVPGLLNGVFGTAKWMAAKAGGTRSEAKAAAARANGAKGGRPRNAG
ncbi:MAG: DUF2442 domain-containing protein [Novosphingobium sp.]